MSDGPVGHIGLSENKNAKEVEVKLNMNENNPYTVTRDQNQIVIDVDRSGVSGKKVKKHLDLYQKISINIQDAALNGVLRLLSTQTGFEFATSPSTTAATPVTIREDEQTLDKVLKDILIPQNFYYELSDGIIRIGSVQELKAAKLLRPKITKFYTPRDMEAADLKPMLDASIAKEPLMDIVTQADPSKGSNRLMLVGTSEDIDKAIDIIANIDSAGSGDVSGDSEGTGRYRTKVFKLENVRLQIMIGDAMEDNFITELKATLGNMITDQGKFSIDRRTSSIIVTETMQNLKKVEKVIKALDVRVPQVSIEAKLYEVSVGAEKDLGVSWNLTNQNSQPAITGSVLGGTVGTGLTGGQLSLGAIQNGLKIDATIRALESKNRATLLSAPKVAVENNQPALILTQRNVYYEVQKVITSQTGPPTVSTEYQSISLPIQLKVFCKSSKDGYINMYVDVEVAKIVPTTRLTGPPDTSTQRASTYIKAKNNETIVIGGLINENISDVEEKVPLLGDLPLLGALFRGTKKTTDKVELVVFLTPSFVEE
jgi:type II secretory pathway component GspD/PulD (secretin)